MVRSFDMLMVLFGFSPGVLDAYGNYTIQKLFECSSESLQVRLLSQILSSSNFSSVYSNLHGSCVLGFLTSCTCETVQVRDSYLFDL